MSYMKSSTRIKRRLGKLLGIQAKYLILFLFMILFGFPLIWVIFGSLKSQTDFYSTLWHIPQQYKYQNYLLVWNAGVGTSIRNSLIVTGGSVLLVLVIGSLASYAFARMKFRGSTVLLSGVILTLMIKPTYTAVNLFRIIDGLGLMDTYLGLILPYVATSLPFAIALFTAYFKTIPQDLVDAALVDGASRMTIFLRIILPLSAPVFSTVIIFTFLDAYNELFLATILLKGDLRTLPVTLNSLVDFMRRDYGTLFAGLTISIVPTIILYLIFQRRFISGMLSGAVKG